MSAFGGKADITRGPLSEEEVVPLPQYCQARVAGLLKGAMPDVGLVVNDSAILMVAGSNPDDRALSWRQKACAQLTTTAASVFK
jgi:hypothetical protein